MRFEPKLVKAGEGWDDETDDFQLPDELAALGDQLHQDALYLARLHPAGSDTSQLAIAPPDKTGTSHPRRLRWKWLGTSLCVSAMVLLATGTIIHRLAIESVPPPATSRVAAKVAEPEVKPEPVHLSARTPIDGVPRHSESNHLAFPPTLVTPDTAATVFPHDAALLRTGGPRAEAYLDYMEMTTVRNVKLSL